MLDGDKVSEPDENSGPAILGREPVFFPEEREEAANIVRDKIDELRG